MKLVGNCHLCGKPAMQTCTNCGLTTCRKCIDDRTGICFGCNPPMMADDFDDEEDY